MFAAIRIGFEEASYTFSEPSSTEQTHRILLSTEDEQLSEQTFVIRLSVSRSSLPDPSVAPALLNIDYRIGRANESSVEVIFPPMSLSARFNFVLLPDNTTEGTEGFLVTSEPSRGSPTYFAPSNLFSQTFIVINDGPVGE